MFSHSGLRVLSDHSVQASACSCNIVLELHRDRHNPNHVDDRNGRTCRSSNDLTESTGHRSQGVSAAPPPVTVRPTPLAPGRGICGSRIRGLPVKAAVFVSMLCSNIFRRQQDADNLGAVTERDFRRESQTHDRSASAPRCCGRHDGSRPRRARSFDCMSAPSSTAMGGANIPDALRASGSVGSRSTNIAHHPRSS